jgi:hypothetical protein
MSRLRVVAAFRGQHPAESRLYLPDQVPHSHPKPFRDLHHRSQRAFHISTLDFADEVMVHVGPLGQLLLGEAGLLAVLANRFAKNSTVIGPLHDLLRKQECPHPSTQYAVYFPKLFACAVCIPRYDQQQ